MGLLNNSINELYKLTEKHGHLGSGSPEGVVQNYLDLRSQLTEKGLGHALPLVSRETAWIDFVNAVGQMKAISDEFTFDGGPPKVGSQRPPRKLRRLSGL